jgi:hypothetical protein
MCVNYREKVEAVEVEVLRCPSAHVHFNGELERQLKEAERIDRLVDFITSGPLVGEELRVQLDNWRSGLVNTNSPSLPMATYTTGGE